MKKEPVFVACCANHEKSNKLPIYENDLKTAEVGHVFSASKDGIQDPAGNEWFKLIYKDENKCAVEQNRIWISDDVPPKMGQDDPETIWYQFKSVKNQ